MDEMYVIRTIEKLTMENHLLRVAVKSMNKCLAVHTICLCVLTFGFAGMSKQIDKLNTKAAFIENRLYSVESRDESTEE